MNRNYEILGIGEGASFSEIESAYERKRDAYLEDCQQEGEIGENAARMLTRLENAYKEIMAELHGSSGETTIDNSVYLEQLEAERKRQEAERQRLEQLERDLQRREAEIRERDNREKERERRKEDRRRRRRQRLENAGEVAATVFSAPFRGIAWFFTHDTTKAVLSAPFRGIAYLFTEKQGLLALTIISSVLVLVCGMFDFVFPLTNALVFPSAGGTAWITVSALFVVFFILFAVSFGLYSHKDGDAVCWFMLLGSVVLAGILMLSFGFSHKMYGASIAIFVIAMAAALIFGIWMAVEESDFVILLAVLAMAMTGVFFGSGLYSLQSKNDGVFGDWYYKIESNNTVTVYAKDYDCEILEIPSEIDFRAVTKIDKPVNDKYNVNLKEIVFPESLTTVGKSAFRNCSSLTSVDMSYVLTVEAKAFMNCSKLTDVTMQDGLKEIQESAFRNCISIEKIIVPDVEAMGADVFKGCTKLTIYCRTQSEPSYWGRWTLWWNGDRPVVWNYKGD